MSFYGHGNDPIAYNRIQPRPQEIISQGTIRRFSDDLLAWLEGRKTLTLEVGAHSYVFHTEVDFEFSLESRTEYPVSHLAALMKLSPRDLRRVAWAIRNVELRLLDLLIRSFERPGSLGAGLRKLELELFSEDHAWRQIFEGLLGKGRRYDQFKQVALAKYLQYLRARQEVVKSIYQERRRRGGASPASEREQELSETTIFDPQQEHANHPPIRFEAQPRGETVDIRLGEQCELEIRLSQHRFQLIGGKHFLLRDETGRQYPLHPGKNFIGRQQGNEVSTRNPPVRTPASSSSICSRSSTSTPPSSSLPTSRSVNGPRCSAIRR